MAMTRRQYFELYLAAVDHVCAAAGRSFGVSISFACSFKFQINGEFKTFFCGTRWFDVRYCGNTLVLAGILCVALLLQSSFYQIVLILPLDFEIHGSFGPRKLLAEIQFFSSMFRFTNLTFRKDFGKC